MLLKYTYSNGAVSVSSHTSGNSVKIEVSDKGIGIPSDSMEKSLTDFIESTNPELVRPAEAD